MASLDFPTPPTLNQIHPAANGIIYQWNGAAWVVLCTSRKDPLIDGYRESGTVEPDPSGSYELALDGRAREFVAPHTFNLTLGTPKATPFVGYASLFVPQNTVISSWPAGLKWATVDGQPVAPPTNKDTRYHFAVAPNGDVWVSPEHA